MHMNDSPLLPQLIPQLCRILVASGTLHEVRQRLSPMKGGEGKGVSEESKSGVGMLMVVAQPTIHLKG